jgi:isopentenyl phosphate kinase
MAPSPEISSSNIHPLQLLKLGGSLITDKTKPYTPHPEVLKRLAQEIADAREQQPGMQLILGHGAGSFGHVPAKKYGTRQGVHTADEWRGFGEVWWEASALNRLVMDALHAAKLPAISLPPSASVVAQDGQVLSWDLRPIQSALHHGLLPVVFGDVIIDVERGGTILSTEDLFSYLARHLKAARILLAGIEDGVWADYPQCTKLIPRITPQTQIEAGFALSGSAATDVTGGMASKVQLSLDLVESIPGLQVLIFSGETPGATLQALLGKALGTEIIS